MAHHKRKRPRSKGHSLSYKHVERRMARKKNTWWNWYASTPSWWNLLFHTRPMRSETRGLEQKVIAGTDPDDIVWPVARKPHKYYW